jgi:hypothetical protein
MWSFSPGLLPTHPLLILLRLVIVRKLCSIVVWRFSLLAGIRMFESDNQVGLFGQSSVFGQPSVFGASTAGFSSWNQPTTVIGTKQTPWRATLIDDYEYQSINAMDKHKDKSFEELCVCFRTILCSAAGLPRPVLT